MLPLFIAEIYPFEDAHLNTVLYFWHLRWNCTIWSHKMIQWKGWGFFPV